MQLKKAAFFVTSAILFSLPASANAAFTAGNIAVSRLSTVGITSGYSAPVFIDEYTTSGTSTGYSVAIPTAASGSNFALTISSTATSAGFLSGSSSSSGKFLYIAGTDAPANTQSPNSSSFFQGRVAAVINIETGAVDTSTRYLAAGSTARSVASVDGINLYTSADTGSGTSGGLRYITKGSTSPGTLLNGTLTNIRNVNIYNGQLYISASTAAGSPLTDYRGVSVVGTGLPTTATTISLLPGFGVSNSGNSDSSYDFAFGDSTTLFVADDDSTSPFSTGLQKWTFSGSTWTKAWAIGAATRSLTVRKLSDGSFEIFGISGTGTDLYRVLDTGVGIPTQTVIASAGANSIFRGVEFVPEPTTLTVLAGMAATALRRRRA